MESIENSYRKVCHFRVLLSGIYDVLSSCRYKKLVILNLIQDLQRLPLQFINNIRGRFQDPVLRHYGAGLKVIPRFGMTALYNKGAFTLIELLVVILIIGILAAVAVPQYQKAMIRSKFAAAQYAGDTLYKAAVRYKLQNGTWPSTLDQLDITLAGMSSDKKSISNTNYECRFRLATADSSILCYPKKYANKLFFRAYTHGLYTCEALNTERLLVKFCASMGPHSQDGGTGVSRRYGYKIN